MLHVKNLSGGYPGHDILTDISFSVSSGELFGILGPNGSGKTTLLKMISGLLTSKHGEILVQDKPLSTFSSKELARIIAVLPQVSSEVFAYTVRETVSLGRYAHQTGWFQANKSEDEQIVVEAMKMTGVDQFADKLLHELSGGERQRVFLAQALAQEPKILLLDEPTNHLDLAYQKELLDQLKTWTRTRDLTVVSIFHDLNIAGLYCDRILLLHNGQPHMLGKPEEVLQESIIQQVYHTKVVQLPHPEVAKTQMLLAPNLQEDIHKVTLGQEFLHTDETSVEFRSPIPLKTMAIGAVHGAGIGWYDGITAQWGEKSSSGLITFLYNNPVEKVEMNSIRTDECTIFIVKSLGFIWIMMNGVLSDEGFLQSMAVAARSASNIVVASTQMGKLVDSQLLIETLTNFI